MALVVTGVGSVIHVYSIGYMKDDEGYGRFFAYLNLFLFFMLLLVLGRSLLVLFVGWEGVGLASYLLIGFWFDDLANARAGKKAFVTNRIGDAGFLLGMFVLFQAVGTLDMDRINAAFAGPALPAVSASLVGVLLFIGATGKSAQIPLHVWLPDAMAGPTPVSALIHAATMVTAGVYLVARMSAVYLHAPEASALIAVVGVATAFFAATIAVVQTDIKKVLAYSTISQLGFMFLALGVGAYGVAIFHLVTHAFFKACLFLGAGSVIHALGGEQDMRQHGRAGAPHPAHLLDLRDRHRGDRRHPAARRLLLQGRDPLVRLRQHARRLAAALARRRGHGADDRVLHVPPALAHLLRQLAHDARGRAPRARVAVLDDRRAAPAGGALGGRRLHRRAALPRAAAAAAAGRRAPARLRDAAARALGGARAGRPGGGRVAVRRAGRACRAAARALRRPAPLALGQVLRRRALRALPRQAAGLDIRPRLPALRRSRPDRRHAARPGRDRAAAARPCSVGCRPEASISTPGSCFVGIVGALLWSWRHV